MAVSDVQFCILAGSWIQNVMTSPEQSKVNKLIKMELLNHTHSLKLLSPIAKVFVYKQWRGFEFDSGWLTISRTSIRSNRTRKDVLFSLNINEQGAV